MIWTVEHYINGVTVNVDDVTQRWRAWSTAQTWLSYNPDGVVLVSQDVAAEGDGEETVYEAVAWRTKEEHWLWLDLQSSVFDLTEIRRQTPARIRMHLPNREQPAQ